MLAAAVIAAAAGGLMGLAAARLRGPYLAGATLMLAVALPEIATRYQRHIRRRPGPGHQRHHARPSSGPTFELTEWLAWFSVAVALITLFLLANLMRSRVGRNWRAVRDDEVAAALSGLNVAQLSGPGVRGQRGLRGRGRRPAGHRHPERAPRAATA